MNKKSVTVVLAQMMILVIVIVPLCLPYFQHFAGLAK